MYTMLRRQVPTFGLAALLVLPLGCAPRTAELPEPPATRVEEVVDVLHGVEVRDPYRWLEDQDSPETRAWIDAQNAYADAVLAEMPGREALEGRLAQLLEVDFVGLPTVAGGRYVFSKRRAGEDLFTIHLREGEDGDDELLLDPHPLSEDHTTSVWLLGVAGNGKLLAYGVRDGGEDELTPRLFDVDRREDLPDAFPKGNYSGFSFAPDGREVVYTLLTGEGPRAWRHAVGGGGTLIFGEGYGASTLVSTAVSEDGRHLVISARDGLGSRRDVFLKDLERDGPFVTVVEGVEASFFPTMVGDRLIVRTDLEAPNGRVMVADVERPGIEHWRELVAQREGAALQSISAVGGRLFANYLEDVKSRVVIFDPEGRELGEIAFDTPGTVSGVGGRWDSKEAFFLFTSFHMPTTVYRYDVASGEREVWARPDMPVDFDRIRVEQVWYDSSDGTRVPMFLVYESGLELDGERPVYLTGYGGFNVSMTPFFNPLAVVWTERGGVYALPALRGGGEFGEAWHEAGKLANKQNVFDDFTAAAEWLISSGYTRPEKLAITGGSNGGLLVGAAMTQRPDLFGAVICTYPVLDMLRYQKFLIGHIGIPEYGSADDPEQFGYLRAYSPYHNVEPGTDYPAVLFITGDADTRVAPLHARKMAAVVQASTVSKPALLRYHTKAGHSGGMPLSEQIGNNAESVGFLLWQLGEKLEPNPGYERSP